MKENAKRTLNACKQQNITIGKYNSQFYSLVYLVEDRQVKTLDKKMAMVSEAAVQLPLLSTYSIPYRPLSPTDCFLPSLIPPFSLPRTLMPWKWMLFRPLPDLFWMPPNFCVAPKTYVSVSSSLLFWELISAKLLWVTLANLNLHKSWRFLL
ncbi:hypothetical protein VP01_1566g7 [Puccinia sorghi]|uniref:Uncharacterized protein n=1 Tax=Puccinia sorghi TaxID=27349 RepID=A0A0L6VJR8_9BASI|nr:hypothetical protein VP01_1566g7 [Puccinia sorghi]